MIEPDVMGPPSSIALEGLSGAPATTTLLALGNSGGHNDAMLFALFGMPRAARWELLGGHESRDPGRQT